jgi:hypothetical protein
MSNRDRSRSATAEFLTPSAPSRRTVLSTVPRAFLFGGLFLLFGGVSLWILSVFGPEVALTVLGVGMVLVAFLLAGIASRVEWI